MLRVRDLDQNAATNPLLFATISAVLVAAGLWGISQEAPPFFADGWGERTVVTAMLADTIHPAPSIQSQLGYLFNCQVALTSLSGRAQPAPARQRAAEKCRDGSDMITNSSPTFSAAWQMGALAAATMEDWPGMNWRLRQAYETGPNEQWLAERRIDLAQTHVEQLDPDLLPRHDRDLILLLLDDNGRRFLAPRYHALADMRARIDTVLPSLPVDNRTRFESLAGYLAVERSRTNGR